MWINSSYTTQIAGMQAINNLLAKGALTDGDYHPVDLHEIQIRLPYGPFQQLYEKKGVYEVALRQSRFGLNKLERPPRPQQRARSSLRLSSGI